MPRNVTVTFRDGSAHVYNGVPDDVTPAQVKERAERDFPSLVLVNIDGGNGAIPGQQGEGARRAVAAANRKEPGILDTAIGTGEAALSAITGATSGMVGMVGGMIGGGAGAIASGEYGTRRGADRIEQAAAEGMQALTYAPRTESGQRQTEAVGRVIQELIPIMGAAPGLPMPRGAVPAAAQFARIPAAAVLDRAGAALQPKAAEVAAPAPVRVAPAAAPVRAAVPEAAPAAEPAMAAEAAGRPIPTLEQYAALRKVTAEPMLPEVRGNFLAWIRNGGGLSMAEKLDITGEAGGVRSNPAGIFRRGGQSSDALAAKAAEEGYLPADMAGDTAAFVDLVQQAIRGERVLTMEEGGMKAARDNAEAFTQDRIRSAEDRARMLGIDPAAAKGDVRLLESYLDRHEPALLATAVDDARPQNLPPEADALAATARQIAQDMEDGGRNLAQYEAEVQPLSPVMRKLVSDELGQPIPAAPVAPPAAAPAAAAVSARRAAPAAMDVPRAMSAEKLAQTARAAGEGGVGSAGAAKVLAQEAAPSRATIKAAQRLKIDAYLQADHVTTNEAYRQIVAAVKSNPQSKIALAEREGLARVAERATELIDEIGGTVDASALDANIKGALQKVQATLDAKGEALYKQVEAMIPAKAEAPANSLLQFIGERADKLGGAENLSAMERMALRKLMREDGAPTYALLDDVRREIGNATRGRGAFKDADTGLAKKLYALLSDDQAAVVEQYGAGEVYKTARDTVTQRKAIEDDLVALFGRDLDRSVVGGGENSLPGAVSALAKGDSSRLVRLLAAVPEELRQQVAASGLASVFRKMGTRGELDFTGFVKWYEGLRRNRQAYTALMVNLPLSARKQIEALYRVSKGVSESLNRRTKTGALATIKAEMIGADTLMENLFSVAKRSGAGLAVETITTPLGMPGAGMAGAIGSALTKGKPRALTAIDELIASPEFEQLVRAEPGQPQQKAAARRLVLTPAFNRFVRAVGSPADLRNPEGWVLESMRAPPPPQAQDRRQAPIQAPGPNTIQ